MVLCPLVLSNHYLRELILLKCGYLLHLNPTVNGRFGPRQDGSRRRERKSLFFP
jgi:hypothetical protein